MLDLAIIGAGPYGLSLAAHAQKANLQYKVFGYPMEFWRSKMPPNMYIRTLLEHTGLSDPDNQFTLKNYQKEKNVDLSYPLPRFVFVDYALWFIDKTKIFIENGYIHNLIKNQNAFVIETEKGSIFEAKNVIVAVGLTNAKHIPEIMKQFPETLVSHTADYTDYHSFKNQSVLVLGGGQSAWEAAALLHQAGASVDLVYRRHSRLSPDKNTNAKQKALASKFYYLALKEKEEISKQLERPTVSDFLLPLVEGKVKQRPNTEITYVGKTKNTQLKVMFNNQTSAIFDHIVTATGYRFITRNLPFLDSIDQYIETSETGEPIVNEHFESTFPNLFFVGPAASYSHGPTFRFISGIQRTVDVIMDHVSQKN